MKLKLMLALFLSLPIVAFAQSEGCLGYRETDYQTLRGVEMFTEDFVGIAGEKPEHYEAYECLLRSRDPVPVLKELVNSDNMPARLYGLMGLSIISVKDYEKFKPIFQNDVTVVGYQTGCLVFGITVAKVVEFIESKRKLQLHATIQK